MHDMLISPAAVDNARHYAGFNLSIGDDEYNYIGSPKSADDEVSSRNARLADAIMREAIGILLSPARYSLLA